MRRAVCLLVTLCSFLTGLKASPIVSRDRIDVSSFGADSGTKVIGCQVSNGSKSSRRVAFDRLDQTLPLPIQNDGVSLLPYENHLNDLHRYESQISGLTTGKYVIEVDGIDIANHLSEELAAGVKLGSVTKGSIYDQAQKVFAAINQKNQIVHQRFRGEVMANIPDWLADLAAEQKLRELRNEWI